MKNVYVKPQFLITLCEAEQVLASSSVTIDNTTTIEGTSAGWTKEENDWDIWEEERN